MQDHLVIHFSGHFFFGKTDQCSSSSGLAYVCGRLSCLPSFLNEPVQALSLTQGIKAANQRRRDLSLTCHVIFVEELTRYFGHEDKPGYNESRLWQKFCASLRS